jgi:hypothetical protein
MITYGFFAYGTYPRHHPCSSRFLFRSNHLCQPPSPAHTAAVLRSHSFRCAYGTIRLSDYSHGIVSHFAFTYRVPYPGAAREPCEFSWGHALIFHTVPSANTLVRWVNENAFASIVQARPCPTFGRPVRLRMAPSTTARYCSANPSDSTSRWTPCPPVVF